jgi:hypothetical protein
MGSACMPNIVSYKSTAHALQYSTIESVHSMPYRDLCPGRVPSVHAPQGVPVSWTIDFGQCRKTLSIFMLHPQKVYTNNLCTALLASCGRIFKEILRNRLSMTCVDLGLIRALLSVSINCISCETQL